MSSRSSRSDLKKELKQYRIRTVHTNAAYKIPFNGDYLFLKIYGPKYPRMSYEIRKCLNGLGVRQPVEYRSPYRRRDFEKGILRYWKASGYSVPAIIENPFHEMSHLPVLTTGYIEGTTIREFFQADNVSVAEKKEKAVSIFRDISERHHVALRNDDNRLFHIDANTRNIILADNMIFHCDFEMGRPWESSVKCASREVLKLLVSLVEDMGTPFAESLCRTFKDLYTEQAVYACIAKGITGRPFQVVHRYSDRRKKEKSLGKVTLYDILRFLL